MLRKNIAHLTYTLLLLTGAALGMGSRCTTHKTLPDPRDPKIHNLRLTHSQNILSDAVVKDLPKWLREIIREIEDGKRDIDAPIDGLKPYENKQSTLLHIAVHENYTRLLEALLDAGANPNTKDKEGVAPLHIAAHDGKLSFLQALLKAKANPNIKDKQGATPLHIAVDEGQAPILQALLGEGANFELQDNAGNTPLHIAIAKKREVLSQALLDAGANPDVQDNAGNTPLHIAASMHRKYDLQLLLKKGANPTLVNNQSKTPDDYTKNNNQADDITKIIGEAQVAWRNKTRVTPERTEQKQSH